VPVARGAQQAFRADTFGDCRSFHLHEDVSSKDDISTWERTRQLWLHVGVTNVSRVTRATTHKGNENWNFKKSMIRRVLGFWASEGFGTSLGEIALVSNLIRQPFSLKIGLIKVSKIIGKY